MFICTFIYWKWYDHVARVQFLSVFCLQKNINDLLVYESCHRLTHMI